jgi:hypothetical protein
VERCLTVFDDAIIDFQPELFGRQGVDSTELHRLLLRSTLDCWRLPEKVRHFLHLPLRRTDSVFAASMSLLHIGPESLPGRASVRRKQFRIRTLLTGSRTRPPSTELSRLVELRPCRLFCFRIHDWLDFH